jgi:muramoyltetrapeptide carboxypeptidase
MCVPDVCPVPALRPGDPVAVVAPAGPVPPDDLSTGLDLLASRYRVRPAENLLVREGYLAGSDERRRDSVNRALSDPDVRGIFCARGGYGVQRILPDLDGDALRADPKPIVGFSDITALLCWARVQGVVAIHGPVVTQLGRLPKSDLEHLFDLLEEPGYAPRLTGAPGIQSCPPTQVEGPLVGGNLSLLGSLAGSPWAPDLDGAILALEDVAEAPYRLDRLLTTLGHQTGTYSSNTLVGVAVGELSRCAPGPAGGPTALEVVAERLSTPERPLVSALPYGHGARNAAFPIGVPARLDPEAGILSWDGGVVR